jgi:hypothetical protein
LGKQYNNSSSFAENGTELPMYEEGEYPMYASGGDMPFMKMVESIKLSGVRSSFS